MTTKARIYLGLALFLALVAAATVWGQPAAAMKAIPAQGYTPESWILTPDAPDAILLCAAPKGGGTLACRTAGDFRAWVRDRKAAR
jgi:hypothetical protein